MEICLEKISKMQEGKISILDNLNFFVNKIREENEKYNIVLNMYEKEAVEKSKYLESLNLEDKKKRKLFGCVILIKSVISKKGFITNCASKTLENYVATFDSDVVRLLEDEGAIILGNLNCDEFASGSTGKNSAFGKTINPNSPNRIPGGSSSGSAAAISAGFCDISIGTDTGGSIRSPASNCFVFGVKPSYNRVSRYGLLDMAMSLDTIGAFCNDLKVLNITMKVISRYTSKDSIQQRMEEIKICEFDKSKKFKIGIIENLNSQIKDEILKNEFERKIDILKKDSHQILSLKLEKLDKGISSYYPIVYCELFSATRKYDGLKYGKKIEDTCREEVHRRILGGQKITQKEHSSNFYKKALKVKDEIRKEFSKAFKKVDFIILPTLPILPPKFSDNLSFEDEYKTDLFTLGVNLGQICAGVVPIKKVEDRKDSVNIGFQILADKFCEEKMFEGMFCFIKTD